jgi:hypothetical protein
MANTTITIAMPIRMLRNSGSMSSSQKRERAAGSGAYRGSRSCPVSGRGGPDKCS